MIKIENFEVVGIEHAIRGMRNPMNSWEKSDSFDCRDNSCAGFLINDENLICPHQLQYIVGDNDLTLMKKLAAGGPVHAKYRRMIVIYLDITAPLYWWKEFDTYKVGTVANSCSTMHKIHEKEFTLEDFSCERLMGCHNHNDERDIPLLDFSPLKDGSTVYSPEGVMTCVVIPMLNLCRDSYHSADERLKVDKSLTEAERKHFENQRKYFWWQMIQLLPSSYNQKRTIMLNYEVLTGIYESRKNHKLDEWREFCKWIEQLPYSEIITGVRDIDMSKIRQKNYGTKEE